MANKTLPLKFMTKETLTFLKQLVKLKTTANEREAFKKAINICQVYLAKSPSLTIEHFERNQNPSLVVSTKTYNKKSGVILAGHLDVVPADDSLFIPKIKNGKMYGRGTYDMKGSCVMMLNLMKDLASMDTSVPPVALILTTDEEIGGHNGTCFLQKDEGFSSDFAVFGEPTNLNICYEQKGVLWLKFVISGKSAHASRPWEGENAVLKAVELIPKIITSKTIPKKESWISTYSLGKISGGDALNKVPESCEFCLDIRYTKEEKPEVVVAKLQKAVGIGVKIDILEKEPPMFTGKNEVWVKKLTQSIKKSNRQNSKTLP